MAAVKKKGGKLVTEPREAPPIALAPKPAHVLAADRVRLVAVLEDDRRAHDKLAQMAASKRHDDEAIGARAVCAYVKRLIERLQSGEL